MEVESKPIVLDDRFWSKTIEVEGPLSTPCRIWTAGTVTNRRGERYGKFSYQGRSVLAHRIACAEREGKCLEEIEVVLHGCDNPLCVAHGKSGTQSENFWDMVDKGRASGFLKDPVRLAACKRAR